MAMVEPIPTNMGQPPMTIDPKLLTLMQWLSPAYPIGAFSWSHGLEAAIDAGWVTDKAGLEDWLRDLLSEGSARNDAIWIAQGYHADDDHALADLNITARAFAPSLERLREAERQGAAFARVTAEVWNIDLPGGQLPLVLGRAARLMELDIASVIAAYLHGFVSNLIAAAQRLMPLGQTDGQRILSDLAPLCHDTALNSLDCDLDDLWSNAFLSDIAAMRHETQKTRLFQS